MEYVGLLATLPCFILVLRHKLMIRSEIRRNEIRSEPHETPARQYTYTECSCAHQAACYRVIKSIFVDKRMDDVSYESRLRFRKQHHKAAPVCSPQTMEAWCRIVLCWHQYLSSITAWSRVPQVVLQTKKRDEHEHLRDSLVSALCWVVTNKKRD